MKILILTFYFQPDLCAGSFRTTNLVSQLKAMYGDKCQINVITTLPNRYSTFSVDAAAQELDNGVNIRRIALPTHKSGIVDQSRGFFHYAKQVKSYTKNESYDLVFATSSRLMTAVLGAHIAKVKKAKLYLDIRDIFVDTINDVFSKPVKLLVKPLLNRLEKISFRQADRINLVSKGFKDYFMARYPDRTYSWYSNGIDEEFIMQRGEGDRQNMPDKPYKIVYAGNLGEGQGLHNIIPALAKKLLGKAEFIIIGDGGRKEQLKLVTASSSNVTLLPPVNRQQLIEVYQKADILFLHLNNYPAFHKVLPSKIFEYAAMGKPILAGVDGFSAQFIQKEVPNAVVFKPCNEELGEKAFELLKLDYTPREEFINRFARNNIMKEMAQDIMSVV